jgi:hypothetical protein
MRHRRCCKGLRARDFHESSNFGRCNCSIRTDAAADAEIIRETTKSVIKNNLNDQGTSKSLSLSIADDALVCYEFLASHFAFFFGATVSCSSRG